MAVNSGRRPAEPGPGSFPNLTEGRRRPEVDRPNILPRKVSGSGLQDLKSSPKRPQRSPGGQPPVSSADGTRLLTEPSAEEAAVLGFSVSSL